MRDLSFKPGLRGWLPLVPPLLTGALLRLWNLSGQIVGGDELHAVRAALSRPLSALLFRYEAPDIYMPAAAALHGLVAAGISLSATWLRLPGLVAGLISLLVLPRLAARFVGPRSAVVFAWLLALSPALVLYSRIARSYLPLILLGTTASLAFYVWHTEGRRSHLVLYVCGALTAVVFHPVAAPAVLAPFAFALFDLLSHPKAKQHELTRRALVAGGGLALALAVWFWCSRQSLLALMANRREPLHFDVESFWGLAQLQAGSTRPLVTLTFWAVALGGAVLLARRQRRFALYLGVLYFAPILGLILLSPVAGDQPLLFNRYTLLALPVLLLTVAAALGGVLEKTRSQLGWAAHGLVALLLGLWWGLGPLTRWQFREGSFAHHNDWVDFGCPPASLESGELPDVYRRLIESGLPGALIEAPWQPAWRFSRSFHAYQAHHQRRVWVVSSETLLSPPKTRLSGVLPLQEEAWFASGARFLVVHLDLAAEEERLQIATCARRAGAPSPTLAARLAEQGEALATQLIAQWGPPQWAELGPDHRGTRRRELLVWDLERARSRPPATTNAR